MSQNSTPTIAFIGTGNMAGAIIGGLVNTGYPAQNIIASARDQEKLQAFAKPLGIKVAAINQDAVTNADVVVLSVKPQGLKQVATELAPSLSHKPVVVSVAAGISLASLAAWLGDDLALVRCMPNTPSLEGVGACGLFANEHTSESQKADCQRIMSSVGLAVWLEQESQIDAVTAVSGSAPAYFFLVMEAMIAEGVRQGLAEDTARQLTLETCLGAATLAKNSGESPEVLRKRVTSPGGTTEQAVLSLQKSGLPQIFADAMTACAERSRAMAKEFE